MYRASSAAVGRLWRVLPRGGVLPDDVWARRHHAVLLLLWFHAVGLGLFALVSGRGAFHALAEAVLVTVAAAVAWRRNLPRSVRSGTAAVGLMTASALLVHLTHGMIEMHFHFFVMVGVIALYRDWAPLLLAVGYVLVHHATLGILFPAAVYNDPAAWERPWRWAALHGLLTLAAAGVAVTTWRLSEEGFHDSLTRLANRRLFADRVDHALARSERSNAVVTVLVLDLDGFKNINDSLGHGAGDLLLESVAARLKSCVRIEDTTARLGADEFAILVENTEVGSEDRSATAVAERIFEALSRPFRLFDKEVSLTASIGIASATYGDGAADVLLRNAGIAMYVAKGYGKGRYEIYKPSMHAAALHRLDLKADLQRAVAEGQFVVHYQPICELETGRVAGLEALVRWKHPARGLVLPGEFIPFAEGSGDITAIGAGVMKEACRQLAAWQRRWGQDPPLKMSVNLSATRFQHADLAEEIAAIIAEAAIAPETLILELTENVLIQGDAVTIERLMELKGLGVTLAIDDFGTGYSSLRYLRDLPVDLLKVDKAFIDSIAGDGEDAGLARAIITLGQTLKLQTVAEGVETREQLDELRALRCKYAQGFLFSHPLDAESIEELLSSGRLGGGSTGLRAGAA